MKRILSLALVLALTLSLCGCGRFVSILPGTEADVGATAAPVTEDEIAAAGDAFEEAPLLSFLSLDDFAASYYEQTPAALGYQPVLNGAAGCMAYVFDRASIIAACDTLRAMTVTGRAEGSDTDTRTYVLTMADGTAYTFTFAALEDGGWAVRSYTGDWAVSGGEALWDMPFPAYSGDFDVFDLYFSDDVRAFADNFYTNTPVSVGLRASSGVTETSEDPDAIVRAFEALKAASVIVVENEPDQHVDVTQQREYIFTMADGTAYSFAFAQRCLAVTANAAFGPVYYWLDGTDTLWNVAIEADSGAASFEGGTVADLRADIAAAAAAADGEGEDEIMNVFVEYDIDGETGYISLDGSVADDFMRGVAAVDVAGELAEDTTGDTFTVFVTLTVSVGPIIYFAGDTVQQLVGVNYVCDGGAMSELRAEVLRLAADYGTSNVGVDGS